MKIRTDRKLLPYIIFSLLTCGIYALWYLYHIIKDVNIMCRGDGEHTPGFAKLILLSILTCGIYTFFWYYKMMQRMERNVAENGIPTAFNAKNTLILIIIGAVASYTYVGAIIGVILNYYAIHLIFCALNAMAISYNSGADSPIQIPDIPTEEKPREATPTDGAISLSNLSFSINPTIPAEDEPKEPEEYTDVTKE